MSLSFCRRFRTYSSAAPISYRTVNKRGQTANVEYNYAANTFFVNGFYYLVEATANSLLGATKSGSTLVLDTSLLSFFNQSEFNISGSVTLASSGTGAETIVQRDDGTENNKIRIEYDWSTGLFYSYLTIGGVQTKTSLGAGSANGTYTFNFTASSSKLGFAAWLNGGYTKYAAVGSLPAMKFLRIKKSTTGGTGGSVVSRWCVIQDRDAWGNAFMREGDSYTGGLTGYGAALAALGRTFSSHGGGLGGSIPPDNTANNPADIGEVARMIAYDDFFDNTIVFCDGNAAGGAIANNSSSPSDIALYERQIWSGLRSYRDVILVTPAILPSSLGIPQDFNKAIRSLFLSNYSSITVDQMAICGPVNAGPEYDISAMDPNSTGHLSDANKALLASGVDAHAWGRGL